MKKLNLLFTALMLVCCVGMAKAEKVTIDGIKYDVVTKAKQATVISGEIKYSGDIVIPSEITYNDVVCSVTSIGNGAFSWCSGLTSVEIPNSVTRIGSGAFSNCSGIKEVHINDLAAWCGIDFYNGSANPLCYAKNLYLNGELVTELVIPDGVKEIKNYTFAGCTGLTSVVIGNSVTSIGGYAFDYCTGLTSVVIGDGVTSIEAGAFSECTGLTSARIGNSVTSIGNYAFSNCTGLTNVEIPNSVTSIGGNAFNKCTGLTSIEIPNSVTRIGYGAFDYCTGLTSVVIGDGVTSIEAGAFSECSGLTSITIPNSVTSIEQYTFQYCTGLTSVVIGNSVTSIGNMAFYECSGLTNITIPNSVTSIGSCAFEGCTGLKSVVIGNSVTSIGSLAFQNCSGLTSVVIGNSVESIGERAFYGCSGFTSVEIPSSVTKIGGGAFEYCSGLTSIVIPNSVTSIGSSAFHGCTGLTSITIPNSVTSIGGSAFSGCKGLTSIKIPNSVTSIGNYAFSNCTGLTNVEIPNSVTSIGNYAFRSCEGLTSVEIPNSVTSIGDGAFYGCTGLTNVVIGNSVTSIIGDAFYGCTSLKTVINFSKFTFSKRSSNYGYVAYYANKVINAPNGYIDRDFGWYKTDNKNVLACYLGNATEITLPTDYNGDNYVIGNFAFQNCTGLKSIEIPNSVTNIGEFAFSGCSGLTSVTSLIPVDCLFVPGNDAFNGVDKTSCTLYIPYGAKETYAATAGWNEFTNIVELEPASLHGDINKDGEVNVGDFAALVNIIFNSESIDETTKSVSDINGDGEVNVGDFAALVNLIFNSGSQASPQRAATRAAADETTFYIEPFSIAAGDTIVIPVLMKNPGEVFSQLQFDITLPEGLEIPEYFDEELFDDVKAIKHGSRTSQKAYSIQTQPVGEALRVLCITQNSKATFNGESGDVLLITVKAADEMATGDVEIKITNTVLSRQDGTTYKPADCTATVTVTEVPTGIYDVKEQKAESKKIYYDLSGRAVENPSSGIYIINGKKVVIK